MNTLKIQIKPFYKNNPFHLKDDQIHILSTNKNEEEIKQLLLQMNYENYSIFIQLELIKAMLKEMNIANIGMNDEDGFPYVVPLAITLR